MCLLCPCLLRCGLLFDCTALVLGPVRDVYSCCGLLIDSFAVGCCCVINLPLCLCYGFMVISYP